MSARVTDVGAALMAENESLRQEVERRRALAEATQLECNRLAEDVKRAEQRVKQSHEAKTRAEESELRALAELDEYKAQVESLRQEVERLKAEIIDECRKAAKYEELWDRERERTKRASEEVEQARREGYEQAIAEINRITWKGRRADDPR